MDPQIYLYIHPNPSPLNSKPHSPFTKLFHLFVSICISFHSYHYFFLVNFSNMSLDGSGLGGMAMAEAYTARKFHRENMKSITANAATTAGGIEENGGGSGRWFFGKLSTKKNSAKVCDLMITE